MPRPNSGLSTRVTSRWRVVMGMVIPLLLSCGSSRLPRSLDLARLFEDPGIPGDLIQHVLERAREDAVERLHGLGVGVVGGDAKEVGATDVDASPDGDHLRLDADQTEVLDGPCGTDAAIANRTHG